MNVDEEAGVRATVRIDQRLCRGTGLCQAMAPELFRLTGAGHAVAVEAELRDDEALRIARSVEECCPMGAVEVAPDPRGGGPDNTRDER
ncbi:ferredoxin [Streptomyces sp. NPDC002156]